MRRIAELLLLIFLTASVSKLFSILAHGATAIQGVPGTREYNSFGLIGFQSDGKVHSQSAFGQVDGGKATSLAGVGGDAGPGEIRFLTRRMTADGRNETNAVATIELVRVGGSAGTISATLQTLDGSAISGVDYWGTNTTVVFGDGELAKRVLIPLRATTSFDHTFRVRLTSERGARVEEGIVLIDYSPDAVLMGTVQGGTNGVRDIAAGPLGKIYVAGEFRSINGLSVSNLARLNWDLSVDDSFHLEEDWGRLDVVALRTNGQILFAGAFVETGMNPSMHIAQVDTNAAYDVNFNTTVATNRSVPNAPLGVKVLPNDQLLVHDVSGLYRLNSDGTRDTNFPVLLSDFSKVVVHPDGTIYFIQGPASKDVVGVNTRNEFQTIATVEYRMPSVPIEAAKVEALAIAKDGSLILGGDFTHVNEIPVARLARVTTNGIVDTNFNARVGVTDGTSPGQRDSVTAITVLWHGDIAIGGKFEVVQGEERRALAVLTAEGRLRREFSPTVEGTGIQEFENTPDGSVVVRGTVSAIDGSPVGEIFRVAMPSPAIPPVAEILWPTNGAEILVSDAVVPFPAEVTAFDVDGFLESVVVTFNGVAVATNTTGGVFRLEQPNGGDHVLVVTATDELGLTSSSTVRFHVTMQGLPFLWVRSAEDSVVVSYMGVRLQSSMDLRTWANVHSGGGEVSIAAAGSHQFFRVAQH